MENTLINGGYFRHSSSYAQNLTLCPAKVLTGEYF
jgi:hypothetical protein